MMRQTITVKEAADYIGVSKDTIYNLARHQQIPHVRVGKRILFRSEVLNDWMNQQETESVRTKREN
ncbi:helix-turn-helix domain-containing protein [Peribacillus simplex]|uniref:helix-turn-helix domain-containing protein n=1 Tax=Peribacillus simplex TaxID=1478 RepID=UPI0024C111E8|nr:helix-turn-helix domain-containing protein [Peribacillus simplex]WHY98830.1 helix-turn-helix domain-containing protein [Peribacillus simplex]